MQTAKIRNIVTGAVVAVKATTEHSSSSYGRPVWVDEMGNAYFEVGTPQAIMQSHGYELVADMSQHKRDLGAKIREAREAKGLTITALARRATLLRGRSVNNAAIVKIEAGELAYTIDILLTLCEVLDLELKIGDR